MEHYYQRIGEDWFDYKDIYLEFAESCTDSSYIVEIGSWMGRSISFLGVELINRNKSPKVYCVDTWRGSREHKGHFILENDMLFETFIRNTAPISKLITPIRLPSIKASEIFADNSIDYLFLDASHEYEDVVQDIEHWYPKVRPGGVFSGHDYHPNWEGGVIKAVDESPLLRGFAKKSNACFYKIK